MISKLYIDKLKRMGPKRTVATGAMEDGTHPVPLDMAELVYLGDLADCNLIICNARLMLQIFYILYHLPFMQGFDQFGNETIVKPLVRIVNGSESTALKFWWPEPKVVTFALCPALVNDYWAVYVPDDGTKLDIENVQGKPRHRIGYTSDS